MFVVMVVGDGGLGWAGCVVRLEAVRGVVFDCVRRRGSERRAIWGWGTAAQSS